MQLLVSQFVPVKIKRELAKPSYLGSRIRRVEAQVLHERVKVFIAVKRHETVLDAASGDYGVDGLAHRNSQIGALLGVGGKIREC